MPRKTYILQDLDCANCAAKIEAKFNAHPKVESAVITFTTRTLQLTAEDPDSLIPELEALARTVEDGVTITEKEGHHEHHGHCEHGHHHDHGHCECGHHHAHDHDHCDCGHHHDHDHCDCGHHHGHEHHVHSEKSELPGILLGAALFVSALLTEHFLGLPWVHIPLFVASYLLLGWEVLFTAGRNLVKGHVFDENFLMSLATLGAFAIGQFPEAVGVMLLYRVGEFFEHKAVERSRSQIMEAVDLRPETVLLANGETIPADRAKPGALLLVRPGDRIPLDGIVVEGSSRIDTAPITGEPVPVTAGSGSRILSGCVNLSGQLLIKAEKPLAESMVTRILNSVENAAASKPKIDRFITRFARIYTPIVVFSALAVAVIPSIMTGDWHYWVYTALSFLVMSCPCALVLSVPLAFFSGIGAGSKAGILFKGGLSIEALSGVRAVALDKTGTVTKGDFRVQAVSGDTRMLRLCASCENASTHPIALSICAYAAEQGIPLSRPETLEEIPGHGIRGTVEGTEILCGNRKLMEKYNISLPEGSDDTVLVAIDGQFAGSITVSDTLKPDAAGAVGKLHAMGVSTAILTGDREETARAVAEKIGISEIHARLLPEEKLAALGTLREKHGAVMFVGDGINDAPVLAGANVGAAMGSGADAAIEAADVVFMTSQTAAVPKALDIARRTKAIAWQNVIFALAVKLIVMVLGLLGYASMWAAVFADSGVAMLCVLNAIRLLYRKK